MENSELLVVAMAEACRGVLVESTGQVELPAALRPKHLTWMCEMIEAHAEEWPATRLHRWIGFVQCALLANRLIDLDRARSLFDVAKQAHGAIPDDLLDHLDPATPFEVELGGES